MGYSPIDFTNYSLLIWLAALGAVIFAIIGIAYNDLQDKKYKRIIVTMFLLSGFFVLALIALIVGAVNAGKVNQDNGTANIIKKYNVSEVLWEARQTYVHPTDTDGDQQLLVATEDGQRYIFHYRVNPKTSEPTLYDMPIKGGQAPDEGVSIKSLIK